MSKVSESKQATGSHKLSCVSVFQGVQSAVRQVATAPARAAQAVHAIADRVDLGHAVVQADKHLARGLHQLCKASGVRQVPADVQAEPTDWASRTQRGTLATTSALDWASNGAGRVLHRADEHLRDLARHGNLGQKVAAGVGSVVSGGFQAVNGAAHGVGSLAMAAGRGTLHAAEHGVDLGAAARGAGAHLGELKDWVSSGQAGESLRGAASQEWDSLKSDPIQAGGHLLGSFLGTLVVGGVAKVGSGAVLSRLGVTAEVVGTEAAVTETLVSGAAKVETVAAEGMAARAGSAGEAAVARTGRVGQSAARVPSAAVRPGTIVPRGFAQRQAAGAFRAAAPSAETTMRRAVTTAVEESAPAARPLPTAARPLPAAARPLPAAARPVTAPAPVEYAPPVAAPAPCAPAAPLPAARPFDPSVFSVPAAAEEISLLNLLG